MGPRTGAIAGRAEVGGHGSSDQATRLAGSRLVFAARDADTYRAGGDGDRQPPTLGDIMQTIIAPLAIGAALAIVTIVAFQLGTAAARFVTKLRIERQLMKLHRPSPGIAGSMDDLRRDPVAATAR